MGTRQPLEGFSRCRNAASRTTDDSDAYCWVAMPACKTSRNAAQSSLGAQEWRVSEGRRSPPPAAPPGHFGAVSCPCSCLFGRMAGVLLHSGARVATPKVQIGSAAAITPRPVAALLSHRRRPPPTASQCRAVSAAAPVAGATRLTDAFQAALARKQCAPDLLHLVQRPAAW